MELLRSRLSITNDLLQSVNCSATSLCCKLAAAVCELVARAVAGNCCHDGTKTCRCEAHDVVGAF